MPSAQRAQRKRFKPISLTFPTDLAEATGRRAKELDLNRSQYFRRLAKQDLDSIKREVSA